MNLHEKVLVLNKNWQAVRVATVQKALTDIYRDVMTAINTDNMEPLTWKEWIQLKINEGDKEIKTIRGSIRVPTVVILSKYDKVHKQSPKLSKNAIAKRDGYKCQVTGEHCPNNGNVDHLIPISRGGSKRSWKNMVWMRKDINSKKGNKTLKEAGLNLIRQPKAPLHCTAILIDVPHDKPIWKQFLIQ